MFFSRIRSYSVFAFVPLFACVCAMPTTQGEVVVRMNEVVLDADGIGRVRIEAFDNAGSEFVTGFNISVEIRDLIMPSGRLVFLDDGTAELARQTPDYVFAGVSALPADLPVAELRNGIYTFTDYLSFRAQPVSLATPKLLAEFSVGLLPGVDRTSLEGIEIGFVDDPNDRNDFVLFGASYSNIAPPVSNRFSGTVVASAVPEPGTSALLLAAFTVAGLRRRSQR